MDVPRWALDHVASWVIVRGRPDSLLMNWWMVIRTDGAIVCETRTRWHGLQGVVLLRGILEPCENRSISVAILYFANLKEDIIQVQYFLEFHCQYLFPNLLSRALVGRIFFWTSHWSEMAPTSCWRVIRAHADNVNTWLESFLTKFDYGTSLSDSWNWSVGFRRVACVRLSQRDLHYPWQWPAYSDYVSIWHLTNIQRARFVNCK